MVAVVVAIFGEHQLAVFQLQVEPEAFAALQQRAVHGKLIKKLEQQPVLEGRVGALCFQFGDGEIFGLE